MFSLLLPGFLKVCFWSACVSCSLSNRGDVPPQPLPEVQRAETPRTTTNQYRGHRLWRLPDVRACGSVRQLLRLPEKYRKGLKADEVLGGPANAPLQHVRNED